MIRFILSFFCVFVSSYLITCFFKPQKKTHCIIFLLLTMFAQVVFTFELLSLFSLINRPCVLFVNLIFLLSSLFCYKKYRPVCWKLNFNDEIVRLNNSIKLDTLLFTLFVGFIFMLIVMLIIGVVYPIVNADAWSYHLNRCVFWIMHGNLNHFTISDIRNLCLPINSEILYTWLLLFVRTDFCIGIFSLCGYILAITSLIEIFEHLGFCMRRRLWIIFILSSFPSVFAQITSSETDLIIAGLVTASLALFFSAVKKYDKSNKRESFVLLFMSALAYALAVGTKTPAFFAIPGCAVFMLYFSKKHVKSEAFFKPFLYFLGFGVLNFIIFSSYNYVLNLIDYHNISGPESFILVSRNYYGIKGFVYNLIKNFCLLFDMTGFLWGKYASLSLLHFQKTLFTILHLTSVKDGLYASPFLMNFTLLDPLLGAGILGFVIFLANFFSSFISVIREKLFLKKKYLNKKTLMLFMFGSLFLLNMMTMSFLISYMFFNIRFIAFLIVLSSPIMFYSYFKKSKFLKLILVLFAMACYFVTSTHLWGRPFIKYFNVLSSKRTFSQMRTLTTCNEAGASLENIGICSIGKFIINQIPKTKKIIFYPSTSTPTFFVYKYNLKGYSIDSGLIEKIKSQDLSKYEYYIFPLWQTATNIFYQKERAGDCIKNGAQLICKQNKDLPCFYNKNKNLPMKYAKHYYSSECVMTNAFLRQHNFKLIGVSNPLSTRNDIESKKALFFIYRNMNYIEQK